MKNKQTVIEKEEDWGEVWLKTNIIDEIDIEELVKQGFSKKTIRKALEIRGYHRVPTK